MNRSAIALSYRHCEQITKARARNFYYGIRLLPDHQRRAMCALYAMARRIDDIGDGDLSPTEHRPAALAAVRSSLALLAAAGNGRQLAAVPPGDPVLIALADTKANFDLPMSAFGELLEGCEWDIEGRRYKTFDDLVEYCRRVAGSIGRLSLAIYRPSSPEEAAPLADALGVALQLTNILRDVVEDRDTMGRVYLPAEDLARFDLSPELEGRDDDRMALICFESGQAASWYEQGLALLPYLDRRSRACTAAMAGIYRRLLAHITADPLSVFQGRVHLAPAQKAAVAALALTRGAA